MTTATRVGVVGGDLGDLVARLVQELQREGLEPWLTAFWALETPPSPGVEPDSQPDRMLRAISRSLDGVGATSLEARHRYAKAKLATLEVVVLVMPAAPCDWALIGALWAMRKTLRLGILLERDAEQPTDLPLALELTGPVLVDPERMAAWCSGRLFSSLMPPPPPGAQRPR